MNLVILILGIMLPPLGAALKVGFGVHFWINLGLTLLGYVPGICHFLWMMFTSKKLD